VLLRVARPRIRPPGYVSLRLNKSNRLVADAVAVIVMGAPFGLGRELVTGARLLSTNNTPTVGLTEEGPAFTNPTNTDQASTEFSDSSWNVLGELTVAWRGTLSDSNYRYIAGKLPASGGGGSNTPYGLEMGNPTTGRFSLVRSNGGGYRVWQQNSSLASTGVVQAASVSSSSDIGLTPTFYVNGVSDSATSQYAGAGSGNAVGNTHFITMGQRPDGNNSAQFLSHMFIVAPRLWSADEHLLWTLAPWGVVEEAPRYYYRTTSGGNTFNDTISDSVTAAESNAATATVRPSLSDAVTAAESNAAAVTANASVSDAATGAEAMAAVATFNAAVSDDTTAADAVTGTVSTVYNETIDDSVTASENMEGDLPNTGDTHDGYLRRSRRERALDAATRRAEEQWRIDRNAVRLALEAAMGMAAEVVEDAPAEAVAAVQEAVREARAVAPAPRAPVADLAPVSAALERLNAAIEAAARAKALADDDEEVLMLLRAL
jgi:hypothetical protein